jgi:hypothetical protein
MKFGIVVAVLVGSVIGVVVAKTIILALGADISLGMVVLGFIASSIVSCAIYSIDGIGG